MNRKAHIKSTSHAVVMMLAIVTAVTVFFGCTKQEDSNSGGGIGNKGGIGDKNLSALQRNAQNALLEKGLLVKDSDGKISVNEKLTKDAPKSHLSETVPLIFRGPNTRRSDYVFQYGLDLDGTAFVSEEGFDRQDEDTLFVPVWSQKMPSKILVAARESLEEALKSRFEVHPLALQLPSTTRIIQESLSKVSPVDVAELSVKYLSLDGLSIAVIDALGREPIDPQMIEKMQRVAGCAPVLALAAPRYIARPYAIKESDMIERLIGSIPSIPAHAYNDMRENRWKDEDQLIRDYLSGVGKQVDKLLALSTQALKSKFDRKLKTKKAGNQKRLIEELQSAVAQKNVPKIYDALSQLNGVPIEKIAKSLRVILQSEWPQSTEDLQLRALIAFASASVQIKK